MRRAGKPSPQADEEWFDPADIENWITTLVDRCRRVTSSTAAGVMLRQSEESLELVHASGERIQLLMEIQIEQSDGPGIDCLQSGSPLINQRLRQSDALWPRFAPMARAMGYQTVHALPMLIGENVGSFTFADVEARDIQREDVEQACSSVNSAAVAILHVVALRSQTELVDQLETALESRVVIEQAKGMVAARLQVNPDRAFDILRRYSRRTRTNLRSIARSIIEGRTTPDELQSNDAPTGTDPLS
jgi:ANTAR domain